MTKRRIYINQSDYINMAEKTDSLQSEFATRQRVNMFSSMMGYLPNPDPVLKKQGKDITIYKDLRADAHVGSQILSRKAGIKSMLWEIDRGKAKSRRAKFIDDVFNGNGIFEGIKMSQLINDILDAPLYGYKFLEIIWEQRGEYIIPARIVGKPSDWFVFDDQNRPLLRTLSQLNGEPLPERKFLLVQHEADYENPYGFPLLSSCFWPVVFKRGGLKFWAVFTEKYGMPWTIGKYAKGTSQEEIDALADVLEDMIQDAVAVIPDDGRVDVIQPSGTASADIYEKLCRYCDGEVSKALLGQTLTTEVGASGSYAAGKVHADTKSDIIMADRELVEETINQLIRWIDEVNIGGGSDHPRIVFYQEEDVDQDLATRDKTLADTGQVKFTKAYYQRAYGFKDDEIIVAEEPTAPEDSAPAMFAEADNMDIVDKAGEAVSDEDMQKFMEQALKPVFDMINKADDFAEVLNGLAELYPKMTTKELEETLARALFVIETVGRAENPEE